MSIGASARRGNRHPISSRPAAPLRRAASAVVESLENRWLLSAGDLDTAFGAGGRATLGLTGSSVEFGTAVARDSSGRVVVAGTQGGTGDVVVARYFTSGALDPSFGNGGKAVISFGGNDTANAIAISGTSIYIAGTKDNDMALARLTDSGALDPTFGGGDGVATADFGAGVIDEASAVAVASDGIYIGGTADLGQNVFAVAKFTGTGAVDTAFGGAVTTAIGNSASITSLLADGTDVIAGGFSSSFGRTSFTIERFAGINGASAWTRVTDFQSATDANASVDSRIVSLANHNGALLAIGTSDALAMAQYNLATGTPDLGFNTANALTLYPTSIYMDASTIGNFSARAGGVDGAGNIVVGGENINVNPNQFAAVRYITTVTGPQRDTSYATATSDVGDPANQHSLKTAAVAGDGSVVLVGDAFGVDQGSNFGGAILNGAGGVVGTFNTDFTGPTLDQGNASVIDSSGRIIVAGIQNNNLDTGVVQHIVLSRFSATGVLDTTFGTGGVAVVNFGTRFEEFQSLAIDSNGNILVAGLDDNNSVKVARYFGGSAPTAGTIDMSFGTAGTLAVDVVPADSQAAVRVAADGDKVVVAGTTGGLGGTEDFYVMRYTSSGAADGGLGGFNGGNILILDPHTAAGGSFAEQDLARAVLVLPDHSIIVGGSSTNSNFGTVEFSLVRLDASGTPNAFAFQDVGGAGEINALALQGSNVVAAGDNFGNTAVVARFNSISGSFDSTFGTGGVASLDSLSTEGGAKGVAVDSVGNVALVTTRDTASALIVVRLTSNGAIDNTFSGDGVADTGLASGVNDSAGITLDASGNLIVTATAKSGLNQDVGLERYLSGNAVVVVNPVATINGAPASATAGTTINLTSTVTAGSAPVQSYAWSVTRAGLPYGSGGTTANFSFTPADAATYVVTLTVTDTDGGASTDTATINVTAATTVSASVIGGVLTINGDGAGNSVNVTLNSAGNYRVVIDGQVNQTFAFGTIHGIFIQAGNGNDIVNVGAGINVAAEIHGGAGNDFLTGGNGNDLLLGEDGNDLLQGRGGDDVFVGGAGNDILTGGNGRDVLIGGLGSDLIAGDSGDDILIAGSTAHDANPTALSAIRTIWSGSGTYATRVSTLRGDLLKSANLFNDTSIDLLSGNSGQDWMIANVAGGGTLDLILGKASNETVTDL